MPPLAELCAASVSGRAATGARAGHRLIRLRSAASVPERGARRPRHAHLGGLYHGVLAGNARLRARAVAYGRPKGPARQSDKPPPRERRRPNPTWAELMRRGLDLDVLECPRCGARMALVASILSPTVARRILEHLALPSEPVLLHPARAPPDPHEGAGADPAATDVSPARARLERARQRLLR